MHYDAIKRDHGLPNDPFTALVVPRPVGWITTINADGLVNLAPYSFYNAVCSRPPAVMFSRNAPKDTGINAEQTLEFVVNLVTVDLRDEMNLTSASTEAAISEPELFEIEMAPSKYVKPPRVKDTPVALECRFLKSVEVDGVDGNPLPIVMTIGQVVGVYINDDILVEGRIDYKKMRPLARLGAFYYADLGDVIAMPRLT